jgi:uncharacterized protein
MKQSWKTFLKFALRHWPSTAMLAFLVVLIMKPGILERKFVYYPMRDIEADPASIGLYFEDVYFAADDGIRLNGWFVPAPDSKITLLVFHGNAGNIGHRVPWIGMLQSLPANVWIIDYRGYGRSDGLPREKGLYLDAEAAYRWWVRKMPGSENRLVVLGESLGGAVAVDLAARHRVDGLILQSTFTCMKDMVHSVLPIKFVNPLFAVRYDSASKISGIHCPKLHIHGSIDDIVPLRLGRRLFESAASPKEYWEVTGARHNDLVWTAGPEYSRRLSDFLGRVGGSAASENHDNRPEPH